MSLNVCNQGGAGCNGEIWVQRLLLLQHAGHRSKG